MLKSQLLKEISAREFYEWSIFLGLKEDDLKPPPDIEQQLVQIFGKPKN